MTLVSTVEPSDTTDKVVWTSNAESVAKVTNGVVKPLSNGSATITATCGSVSATCSVTVDIAEEEQVTLTSISVTYTGGNVTVGTALTDLTGITVTGTYSDGSTANVTGYTLSGTIVEGSNTITVSYGGKTTTFTVTGVVESGGETLENLYVRNGEYLYGSPTEVVWGDNSLSYKMGTSQNGVYTHVGEAYHLEVGKTYTLFVDMSDKADFVRVLSKANDINAYLGSQLGQITVPNSRLTFTVPEDAKWVNLLFGLSSGTAGAVAGDLGTFENIAIYEGELTKRP